MSQIRLPWERRQGNSVLTTAAHITVVPAKAGIQEIPQERASRLPRVLDSGFRRNDGFMQEFPWEIAPGKAAITLFPPAAMG